MEEGKPIKPEYGQLTKPCRIFAALNFFLLFGIFYFIAKEWKRWGVDKMGLKSESFFGAEFWLFVVILVLFLILLKILLVLEKKIFE